MGFLCLYFFLGFSGPSCEYKLRRPAFHFVQGSCRQKTRVIPVRVRQSIASRENACRGSFEKNAQPVSINGGVFVFGRASGNAPPAVKEQPDANGTGVRRIPHSGTVFVSDGFRHTTPNCAKSLPQRRGHRGLLSKRLPDPFGLFAARVCGRVEYILYICILKQAERPPLKKRA